MIPSNSLALDGACDCHIHVYEPRYALAPTATFVPPPAPVSAYRAVQQALGLSRAVVVQPTGYGFDNACTLAAMQQFGPVARGVAVVEPGISDADLQRLHAAGMRGVRFMMLPGGLLGWEQLEPMATRIAAWGWHINLQMDGRDFPQRLTRLQALAVPLVIDHIGKFLGPVTPLDPAFLALRRLLDGGRCWVKLSAPYESSRSGAPAYADVGLLAQTLAQDYPERCLWASNWPHPNRVPAPTNPELRELLASWVPGAATLERILVSNPKALYGFED